MTLKQKGLVAGGSLLLLAASFTAGRYSRPAKIVEKTVVQTVEKEVVKTEWKDRIVYVQAKEQKKHVTTVTEKKPTGEVIITRTEDTHTDTDTKKDTATEGGTVATRDEQATATTEKTTTYDRPGWRVAGQVGVDLSNIGPFVYQGTVARRLFGTLWLDVSVQGGQGSWKAFAGPALEF